MLDVGVVNNLVGLGGGGARDAAANQDGANNEEAANENEDENEEEADNGNNGAQGLCLWLQLFYTKLYMLGY